MTTVSQAASCFQQAPEGKLLRPSTSSLLSVEVHGMSMRCPICKWKGVSGAAPSGWQRSSQSGAQVAHRRLRCLRRQALLHMNPIASSNSCSCRRNVVRLVNTELWKSLLARTGQILDSN